MANITIEVSDRSVLDAFNRLLAAAADPAPALNAVGRVLKTRVQQGFVSGTDPYGHAWLPLKRRKGSPLRDTGRLMNSIDYRVEASSVFVGTNVVYAAVHQFGADIEQASYAIKQRLRTNKKGELLRQEGHRNLARYAKSSHKLVREVVAIVPAHTTHIPPRPFMPAEGLPEDWRADVVQAFNDYLERATDGG